MEKANVIMANPNHPRYLRNTKQPAKLTFNRSHQCYGKLDSNNNDNDDSIIIHRSYRKKQVVNKKK